MNYQGAEYLISVADLGQLPEDKGVEVAFAGRSNAGKSSLLNTLTNQKSLARVSKTPGRTQLINLFELDERNRLADLPGYGYAKVPEKMKRHWQELLDNYLQTRKCLAGIVLVMDIRHPMQTFDWQMVEWAAASELPMHIALTKADKLKRGPGLNVLQKVKKELKTYGGLITVQVFSSLKNDGVAELKQQLDTWFVSE